MSAQFFFERADGWLFEALFCTDRHQALAAASNIMKALRHEEGRDAMLIAISENPCLTRAFLPRVWALRQSVLRPQNADVVVLS